MSDQSIEVLSDYRIPPSILDLFVNDRNRRFFQRIHRTPRDENRNCDNMEIYACSPSYLISAGGAPATYAVNPHSYAVIDGEKVYQQLGAAVTTTFMPTGFNFKDARDLIQFGSFSRRHKRVTRWKPPFLDPFETNTVRIENVENYGVAPDFACGDRLYLPSWVNNGNTEGIRDGVSQDPRTTTGFSFVRMGIEAWVE